jgi:hypothetical protein
LSLTFDTISQTLHICNYHVASQIQFLQGSYLIGMLRPSTVIIEVSGSKSVQSLVALPQTWYWGYFCSYYILRICRTASNGIVSNLNCKLMTYTFLYPFARQTVHLLPSSQTLSFVRPYVQAYPTHSLPSQSGCSVGFTAIMGVPLQLPWRTLQCSSLGVSELAVT